MNILITNDDGIGSKGIYALAKELEKENEVLIVAPDDQRSACGHSITITRPLVVKETKLEGIKSKAYSVNGTPADCVRVGVDRISSNKVDIVISGINRGFNVATDVIYSGTVSAAIEAAIYKIPSMAISTGITDEIKSYEVTARYASKILAIAKEKEIKNDVVLNVNVPLIPENQIKGIKVCKIGNKIYKHYFVETLDINNGPSLEIKAEINDEESNDADTYFIKNGYVTLTPLHYDLTNFKILNEVTKWF